RGQRCRGQAPSAHPGGSAPVSPRGLVVVVRVRGPPRLVIVPSGRFPIADVPLTVEALAGGGVISPLAGRLVALVARLVVDAVPLLAIPTNIDVLVSRIGLDQLLPGARLGPLQVLQVIR